MAVTAEFQNSLAHSEWDCKYHVMAVPKWRRKVWFEKARRQKGEILRTLTRERNVRSWKRI